MSYLSADVQFILKLAEDQALLNNPKHIQSSEHYCHDFDSFLKSIYSNCAAAIQTNPLLATRDYHNAVKSIGPLLQAVSCINISSAKLDAYGAMLVQWFHLTSLDAVSLLKSTLIETNSNSSMVSLLLLTALLERALGNLFLVEGSRCPFLLRDLFISKELQLLCEPKRMKFFQVLLGGPLSLNLRNLAWHGFAAPGEIPTGYVKLLLAGTIELVLYLEKKRLLEKISPRPSVMMKKYCNVLKTCLVVPQLMGYSNDVESLIQSSCFIHTRMLSYFEEALHCYNLHKFGECVVLLLPQLEHLLRCRFAKCNNCPERVKTAESNEFYTTMDEILAKDLNDGSANLMRLDVGEEFLTLLMDVFSLPDGMRLRDRLSHGETHCSGIDRFVADLVLCIVVYSCHKRSKTSSENPCEARQNLEKETEVGNSGSIFTSGDAAGAAGTEEESASLEVQSSCPNTCPCYTNSIFAVIANFTNSYQPQFHPLAFAKRDAETCLAICCETELFISEHCSELRCRDGAVDQLCKSIIAACFKCFASEDMTVFLGRSATESISVHREVQNRSTVMSILQALIKMPLKTLYRSQSGKNAEAAVLLRQIARNSSEAASNLLSSFRVRAEALRRKELRSRQRKNYMRLITCYPAISSGLRLLCCEVLVSMRRSFCPESFSTLRRRFKLAVKTSENLVKLTSSDVNKWEESLALCQKLCEVDW